MRDHDEDFFVRRPVTSDAPAKKETDLDAEKIEKPEASKRKRIKDEKKSVVPEKKEKSKEEAVAVSEPELDRHRFLKIPETAKLGNVDMVFLVLFVLLLAIGAIMSFSASYAYAAKKYGDSYYFIVRHLGFMALGAIGVAIVTMFPLQTYKTVTYIVFGVSIVLLILVLVKGVERGGAKRWLQIPGFGTFQPSELAKTSIVMMLAYYLSLNADKVESKKWREHLPYGIIFPGLLIGLIGGLVVLEKHFSGLVIICCIGLAVMVLGGSKLRYIVPIGLAAAAGIAVMILFTGYSSTRIQVWLDPWSDLKGTGWQTIQGLYAIASGGLAGVGLGNSRQKYGYISEPQNDFIFTVVCEELGFVGAAIVILLFLALIWRGFMIARHSPNRFTYLMVMGLMVKVALQVGFNIAVVTNTIPNTGISLPFFSSGGTSLLVQMLEMGIVLSVSRYSHNEK